MSQNHFHFKSKTWLCEVVSKVFSIFMKHQQSVLARNLKFTPLSSLPRGVLLLLFILEVVREGEKEKHQCERGTLICCLPYMPWTYKLGMWPDWKSNPEPIGAPHDASTESYQPRPEILFLHHKFLFRVSPHISIATTIGQASIISLT